MQLGLMVSGSLGFEVLRFCNSRNQIEIVFTDSKSIEIIEFANSKSIPLFKGNPRSCKASLFISNHSVDILLSINYLFLIEQDLIGWPKIAAINFHGSLLPKYRGRTPHVWAIINNEKCTGVTAHFITTGCDEGDIILQKKIEIEENDTGADILDKYLKFYPEMVNDVINLFSKKNVVGKKQNHENATFFGKRTPEDGEIDWNWQKERIRNWVRAQAFPYPGAFSVLNGTKIIFDEVVFDDFGYNQNQTNGSVLSINPLRVKTPNGVLKIIKHRGNLKPIKPMDKFD